MGLIVYVVFVKFNGVMGRNKENGIAGLIVDSPDMRTPTRNGSLSKVTMSTLKLERVSMMLHLSPSHQMMLHMLLFSGQYTEKETNIGSEKGQWQ